MVGANWTADLPLSLAADGKAAPEGLHSIGYMNTTGLLMRARREGGQGKFTFSHLADTTYNKYRDIPPRGKYGEVCNMCAQDTSFCTVGTSD